jgi:hypothetical protein
VVPDHAAIAAWAISFLLVCFVVKKRSGMLLDRKALLLRLPAAVLWYVLLAYMAEGAEMLVIYAIAFVPPYLTMMVQPYFMVSKNTLCSRV